MKIASLIAGTLLSTAALAQAIPLEMVLPRSSVNLDYDIEAGLGFDSATMKTSVFPCVKGKFVEDVIYSETPQGFGAPIITIASSPDMSDKSEVTVSFKARGSYQKVLRVETNGKYAKYPNRVMVNRCGTHYVSEVRIGAEIRGKKSFTLPHDQAQNLANDISLVVKKPSDVKNIDLSAYEISGVSSSASGKGFSKEMEASFITCLFFYGANDCEAKLQQIEEAAKNLDVTFNAEKVRTLKLQAAQGETVQWGDWLGVTVRPYKK